MTFPKGARIDDPDTLFNARLGSATVRAIDDVETSKIDALALRQLIRRVVMVNRAP